RLQARRFQATNQSQVDFDRTIVVWVFSPGFPYYKFRNIKIFIDAEHGDASLPIDMGVDTRVFSIGMIHILFVTNNQYESRAVPSGTVFV
ncbi:hypothetical protein, partial [Solemya velum gill symbiont]|uniref:hypothetical protein n=1 Tax=Solemya velum gill symbiont TaxID=2340 RepID=UPI001C4E05F2